MSIIETVIPQLEHEFSTTRTVLAVVPWEKSEWQPHKKSMTLSALATHLADAPKWCMLTCEADEFNAENAPAPKAYSSLNELLVSYDSVVSEALAACKTMSDEQCVQDWVLRKGDAIVFAMPRIAAIRSFVLSHMIHHRGQLSVYLRLLDVALPSIYGPSADTPM